MRRRGRWDRAAAGPPGRPLHSLLIAGYVQKTAASPRLVHMFCTAEIPLRTMIRSSGGGSEDHCRCFDPNRQKTGSVDGCRVHCWRGPGDAGDQQGLDPQDAQQTSPNSKNFLFKFEVRAPSRGAPHVTSTPAGGGSLVSPGVRNQSLHQVSTARERAALC